MTKQNYLPHLADRVLGRPLLVLPEKAAVILDVLSGRINIGELQGVPLQEAPQPQPAASHFVGEQAESGYYRIEDGAAIIPVLGTLVNRGAWIGSFSGETSYEGISAQLAEAVQDDKVTRIVLDINSPGGEAGGIAHLAQVIRDARKHKPVVALVNDMAASAAYWLASSCERIFVSKTSTVGSIGVVWAHVDQSEALSQHGVKVTLVHAGAHKADGNPYGPMSEQAQGNIQAEINSLRDVFAQEVAEGRPSLSTEDIVALEARTLIGEAAIKAGLADEIGGLEQALAFAADKTPSNGGPRLQKGFEMSGENQPAAQAGAGAEADAQKATITQADLERAVTAATQDGQKLAAARIKAILTHDAAQGRQNQAMAIAFETDMSPEAAAVVLAAGAKEAPSRATSTPMDAVVDMIARDGEANMVDGTSSSASIESVSAQLNPAQIYGARRQKMTSGR